jgi:hypothetical protein
LLTSFCTLFQCVLSSPLFFSLLSSLFFLALHSGEQSQLCEALQRYADEKAREIADVCDKNYRALLDTVEELMALKKQAAALKETVLRLQGSVEQSGRNLKDALEHYNSLRRAKKNVQNARATLESCAEVLRQCKRVQEYLNSSKYSAALRLMEELEADANLQAIAGFSFGQYVIRKIPELKHRVKMEVTAQFSAWLLLARDAAPRVGRTALLCSADDVQQRRLFASLKPGEQFYGAVFATPRGRGPASYRELVESAGCQLAPPHRCLYIYNRLGLETEFKRMYIEARRTQAKAGWEGHELLESFFGSVGFFVVEDAVGLQLLEAAELHQLWDAGTQNVTAALNANLSKLGEGQQDELAQYLMLAMKVARSLYLPLDRLQQAAQVVAQQYLNSRAAECQTRILSILLDAEHSAPLVLSSEEEWAKFVVENELQYTLDQDEVEPKPLTWESMRGGAMPFTLGVPLSLERAKVID